MKLAKLDFLLRYPDRFTTLMAVRRPNVDAGENPWLTGTIEQSMIRYRYGPWDPAYYALLGALTGKGLIEPKHEDAVATYCTTQVGHEVARALAESESWNPVRDRAVLLRRHFNLSGITLKNLIYETFPTLSRRTGGPNYETAYRRDHPGWHQPHDPLRTRHERDRGFYERRQDCHR
ncbi:hypothetical protein WKI68_00015 [Streptomyces sp. MS1.HAVA.3]|uniref:Uncharacterized protein n=1 Tax=Streptomyces caledonius TaxID=3134107 RepID=A0ABU8TX77_9ACTN